MSLRAYLSNNFNWLPSGRLDSEIFFGGGTDGTGQSSMSANGKIRS